MRSLRRDRSSRLEGTWATGQVGRYPCSGSEVAESLGTGRHTINDVVVAYGEALPDAGVDRTGVVEVLSFDETLFTREGRRRIQQWSTRLCDARSGQLLEVVESRNTTAPAEWLAGQDRSGWRASVGR